MTHGITVQHNYAGRLSWAIVRRRVSRSDGLIGRLDDLYPGQGAAALGLHGMHEVLETCQRMRGLARAKGIIAATHDEHGLHARPHARRRGN